MAKSKIIFECNQCGYQSGKWNGRCPDCGSWNSFEEVEQITSSKTSTSKKTADLTDKYWSFQKQMLMQMSDTKQEQENLTVFWEAVW